jgi:hypothetical protein
MAFGLPEVVAAPSAKLDSAEGPTQFEFVNAKSDTEVCMVPPGQKCRDNRHVLNRGVDIPGALLLRAISL